MQDIKLALIGKNISHSKSQRVYEEILKKKIIYDLLDIDEEKKLPNLNDLFSRYQGVSITSPYKESFFGRINYSNEKFKSINCLFKKNKEFWGINTDYLALKIIFSKYKTIFSTENFFYILGDGPMSKLCEDILKGLKLSFKKLTRKKSGDLQLFDFSQSKKRTVIINACSRNFVYKKYLDPNKFFYYDLNYETSQRNFITCPYMDGKELLFLQAQEAIKYWPI